MLGPETSEETGGRRRTPPSFHFYAHRIWKIVAKCLGWRDLVLRYLVLRFWGVRLLAIATLLAACSAGCSLVRGKPTFTGVITDDMCPKGDHSVMQMGPTDAECVLACVDIHGSLFVLWDGKNLYTLSDQRTPKKFAAKKVRVTGTLDDKTKTIQVESITALQ
jgi:hypothetical protein